MDQSARNVFKSFFDSDGKGYTTETEVKEFINKYCDYETNHRIQNFFKKYDVDGDKKVTLKGSTP